MSLNVFTIRRIENRMRHQLAELERLPDDLTVIDAMRRALRETLNDCAELRGHVEPQPLLSWDEVERLR